MQYLVELSNRPPSAVDADESRDITITGESDVVMQNRLREVTGFLSTRYPLLKGIALNPVLPNKALPNGVPGAFYPPTQTLFRAMGKKVSPGEFSALCLLLLNEFGDGIGEWL